MPLILVNCKPGWYPPDDPSDPLDAKHGAALAIGKALPTFVSSAVNKADEARGTPDLTTDDVLVNFGRLHWYAINASDMQILIMPGIGDTDALPLKQAVRRAEIRNHVHMNLRALVKMDEDSLSWPGFDIEVIPMSMSGFAVTSLGEIDKRWGDPPVD